MTLIIFIIILGLLVFVHEFGHFIVARRHGVKAEEFGFGFPPRIIGIWRRANGRWRFVFGNKEVKDAPTTIYSINWLPFGGFVKIKGEAGECKSDPDSFASKSAWRRGTILLAGVAMNVLLTVVLLSIGFTSGIPVALDGLESYARVRDKKIEIVDVLRESPAARAGIRAGDVVLSVNNTVFPKAEALRDYFSVNQEESEVLLRRDGGELRTKIMPEELSQLGKLGIGVYLLDTGIVSYPWYYAAWKGLAATGFLIREILFSFGQLIKNLVLTGKVAVDLSGPVGIAVLTGRVARLGFAYLLHFTALLSINLAILNVLPIPALDGGRFLFLLIEKVRGRPVSRKVENIIHNIGFILLILLVLIVTYRDLLRFQDVILKFLRLR